MDAVAREIGAQGGTALAVACHISRTSLSRHGVPEDLVGTAIFLASDASAYVTGQTIVVDGGSVM